MRLELAKNINSFAMKAGGRTVQLTNLQKLFWPELGITKGDLLSYYIAICSRAAAASEKSRDGDEALSQRHRRRVLFHEAGARSPPRLAAALHDQAQLGQHHRLSRRAGSGVIAVDRKPRLHRPESVVCAMRRHRSSRLSAFRSRSGAAGELLAGKRGRAARSRLSAERER